MNRLPALLAAAAFAFAGATAVSAQTFSEPQRGEIEKIIKEYLLKHPEVLQEAMAELEKRQAVAEAEKARVAVKTHADAIFNSPRQVTLGNPQGDVTFVEFFDYNCGYCKRALDDMNALMAKEIGLDMARLEKDLKSDEIDATLAESLKLAEALGLNGTPSYVIGNDIVIGAVGLAKLGEKIQAARQQ